MLIHILKLFIILILLAVAVLYFLSPIDIVPDILPPFTWIDDILVFLGVIYGIWKIKI